MLQPQRLTVVADVGASAIDVPPYAFLLSQGACEVWGFEPQKAEFDRLVASAGQHEHYLPQAVGDGTIKTLHITRHPGFTSTLRPNTQTSQALNRWQRNIVVKSAIEIQTVRVDDMPDLPAFDLLKIDIQGGEVRVVQNGTGKLASAVAVITEAAAIPIYEHQPLLCEQMQCLGSQGFNLHKFMLFRGVPFRSTLTTTFPCRKITDQLSDGDAVFVRSLLDLQSHPTEALKHLCILSDFVFHSASLALKAMELLVERDEIEESAAKGYAALLLAGMTKKRRKSG